MCCMRGKISQIGIFFSPVQKHKLMRRAVIWVILDHAALLSNDNNYVLKTSVGCARSLSLPHTLLSDQCLFLSPGLSPPLSGSVWEWTNARRALYTFEALFFWHRSSVLWLQSSTSLSLNSSGVKRFRLSWRQGWLFTSAGLERVCVSTILCVEDGRAFVPKHFLIFTPPNSVQKGGNSSSLTRVVFPVGWLVIQQSPRECRKSDPKSPGTNETKGGKFRSYHRIFKIDKEMSYF